MSLAENIRYLRIKNGFSQDYVAEQLGYKSYTTIQKWESGVSVPPVKKLRELSDLLGADISDMANADLCVDDVGIKANLSWNDEQQRRIFSHNLNRYLSINGKTQKEVANAVGVIPSTFNTWCQGVALPRMGKIQALADYFHVSKSDLLDEIPELTEQDNKQIIARNIRHYMNINHKTRQDMCDALGVKYTTFTDWVKGNSYPRIDKIEMMSNYFGISKSELIEDNPLPSEITERSFNEIFAERLRYYLQKYEMTQLELSKRLGVGTTSVYNWCNGIKTPRMDKVDAMCVIFHCKRSDLFVENPAPEADTNQSLYIDALPEGERAELIDGVVFDMSAPSRIHQEIVSGLNYAIRDYIERHGGSCRVYPAPFAVYPLSDDRNYVEPDISVICDKDKLNDRGCSGAPDLIVEVVSSASRWMDYFRKTALYAEAGVREYWIVDPEKKRTTVYRFEEDDTPIIYPFDSALPVGIYDNLSITVTSLLAD